MRPFSLRHAVLGPRYNHDEASLGSSQLYVKSRPALLLEGSGRLFPQWNGKKTCHYCHLHIYIEPIFLDFDGPMSYLQSHSSTSNAGDS